jgi:UDP-N-acetylglucosamine 2-epimerase
MKVLTVVGTRPEIIRLSETIKRLNSDFNHKLVHTGQNYSHELNDIFFDDLNVPKPDYYLESAAENPTLTIANILTKLDVVLRIEKPDAFLILGDTNSCLSAIAAKKLKIPIFHMEAGNRCFDQRVPEEINRKIIDHLSDVNLTYSQISREYLLSEGIKPEFVIKTGSPMYEVLRANELKWKNSQILEHLSIVKDNYLVASFHREENVESQESLLAILSSLNILRELYNVPIIVSTHPRTAKRIEELDIKLHPAIKICKPFSFSEYINLQVNSLVVLSDSGTITEESSILKFTAINLRNTQERPEGMEEASVILAGLTVDSIVDSVNLSVKHKREGLEIRQVDDYLDENVSVKISRIIRSYTPYVNEYIWKKR